MSTEELKIITQAISQLGADGKTAFIVWVVVNAVTALLVPMAVGCGIALPLILARHAIAKICIAIKKADDL